MANSFLDTSALVNYYHPEDGTQEVTQIIEAADSRSFISELSLVETVSAFAVKFRTGNIDDLGLAALRLRFHYDISEELFRIIPLTTSRYQEAAQLIQKLAQACVRLMPCSLPWRSRYPHNASLTTLSVPIVGFVQRQWRRVCLSSIRVIRNASFFIGANEMSLRLRNPKSSFRSSESIE